MTNKCIALLLAFALAACSSVPRFGSPQPASPAGSAAPASTAADNSANETQPEKAAPKTSPERPHTSDAERSHLTEIGKGLVLVALIALMVWLQYRAVCPYSYC